MATRGLAHRHGLQDTRGTSPWSTHWFLMATRLHRPFALDGEGWREEPRTTGNSRHVATPCLPHSSHLQMPTRGDSWTAQADTQCPREGLQERPAQVSLICARSPRSLKAKPLRELETVPSSFLGPHSRPP